MPKKLSVTDRRLILEYLANIDEYADRHIIFKKDRVLAVEEVGTAAVILNLALEKVADNR